MRLTLLYLIAICFSYNSTTTAQKLPITQKPASATDHATEDETTVRRAYAKLAFLTQFTVYAQAAVDLSDKDTISLAAKARQAEIDYTLSNVKAGPISEITEVPWGQLVTVPSRGDFIVRIDLGRNFYQYDDTPRISWQTAKPHLDLSRDHPEEARSAVLSLPVKKILELGGSLFSDPNAVYTRYVTYEVRLHLQGLEIGPYKALFFFGSGTGGETVVAPQDLYLDGNGLTLAVREPLYPSELLHSAIRDNPLLANFLKNSQMDSPTCSSQSKDLCCTDLKCGLAQSDLQRDMSAPLTPARY